MDTDLDRRAPNEKGISQEANRENRDADVLGQPQHAGANLTTTRET
jgi:hypothetical protein